MKEGTGGDGGAHSRKRLLEGVRFRFAVRRSGEGVRGM